MYHWDNGLEIDLLDSSSLGFGLSVTNTRITLSKYTASGPTVLHYVDWDG